MKILVAANFFYSIVSIISAYTVLPPDFVPDFEPEVIKNATVTPLNYTIQIRPILDGGYVGLKVDTAEVGLQVRVKGLVKTNVIEMEHKDLRLNLDGVRIINVTSGEPLIIANHSDVKQIRKPTPYDDHAPLPRPNLYTIKLEQEFLAGEELEIFIPYEFNLTKALDHSTYSVLLPSAFGFDEYPDGGTNETKKFAITNLERYDTEQIFPQFVSIYDSKSTYKIVVGRIDGKYQSLSNMDLNHTEPDPDHAGWVWDHYKETFPLFRHQIFVLMSDFSNHTIPIPNTNMAVSTWATKSYLDNNTETVARVTSVASDLLQYYNDLFKTPFPSNKLDIVILPTVTAAFQNAEYFGVIVTGANDVEKLSRNDLVRKIAGEIAKQWFGTVVSVQCSKCSYPAQLQEELLTYATSLGVQHLLPGYPMDKLFNGGRTFDQFSHTRLKMMEEALNKPIMETALANFVDNAKLTAASEDDFYDAIDKSIMERNGTSLLPVPEVKMQEIVPDWLAYYPELLVRVNLTNNTLTFSHEGHDQFRPNDTSASNTTYWTPITIQFEDDGANTTNFHKLWIPKNTSSVNYNGSVDPGKWILLNPNGYAPYRVLYEDFNLTQALADQLVKDHNSISAQGRAKLMGDQISLALENLTPIETALELSRYLEKETDMQVWQSVIDRLVSAFEDNLKDDPEALEEFRKYFVPKLQALVERIGIEGVMDSYILQRLCATMGIPKCIEYANEQIDNWRNHPELDVASVFSSPVSPSDWICGALAESMNESTWNFLLERFLSIDNLNTGGFEGFNFVGLDKFYLIEGLACSRNLSQISSLLEQSVGLSSSTQNDIFDNFARSRELNTRKALYDFAKANVLSGKITPETFSNIIIRLVFPPRFEPNIENDLREFMNANMELLRPVITTIEGHLPFISTCTFNCDWWDNIGSKANAWFSAQNEFLQDATIPNRPYSISQNIVLSLYDFTTTVLGRIFYV